MSEQTQHEQTQHEQTQHEQTQHEQTQHEQTQREQPQHTTATGVRPSGAMTAALWGSAFVLAALILFRADGLFSQPQPPVNAEMVTTSGDYQMMTTAGAANGELVYVLDSRAERLVVYSMDPSRQLNRRTSVELPRLFSAARGGGRTP